MATFDILNNDAFTRSSLIAALDNKPFKPNFVTSLGVFRKQRIRTEQVMVENRNGSLALIPLSSRGEPLKNRVTDKRSIRNFSTFRLGKQDTIMASELQFIRQFGTEQAVSELQAEIARRLGGGNSEGVGILDELDLTREYMMLAALAGNMVDADGTVIYDYATEFGITPQPTLNTTYGTIADGDFRVVCNQINRSAAKASAYHWKYNTRYMALCSPEYFDNLSKLPEVRQRYRNENNAGGNYVMGADSFDKIEYGNITFVDYRGTDDNSTIAIPTNAARLVPINAHDAFAEVLSPGEKFTHIGEVGADVYPEVIRDRDDEMLTIKARTYPLFLNKAPQLSRLIKFV
jgi:hypothetical protein